MYLAILLIWAPHGCLGLVPFSCTTRANLDSRTCCPLWDDGSPCGTASERGSCEELAAPPAVAGAGRGGRGADDFRELWPTYFFSRLCRCKSKFRGVDCGDCQAGWKGRRCDERAELAVRRDCSTLSGVERERLVAALQMAKTTTTDRWSVYTSGRRGRGPLAFRRATLYDAIVWAHYVTGKSPPGGDPDRPLYGHQSAAFMSWHRVQLAWFDRQLRNITGQPDLALCVWRWAGKASCDICTPNFFGGASNGDLVGNFANWTVPCNSQDSLTPTMDVVCPPGGSGSIRRFTRSANVELPSKADLAQCLDMEEFDTPPFTRSSRNSFRNTLEGFIRPHRRGVGMHNRVHQFINGMMDSVYLATADPLFFPLHAFSDEICQMWIDKETKNGRKFIYPTNPIIPEGHRNNDYAMPFLPLWSNKEALISTQQFGYTYEKSVD